MSASFPLLSSSPVEDPRPGISERARGAQHAGCKGLKHETCEQEMVVKWEKDIASWGDDKKEREETATEDNMAVDAGRSYLLVSRSE